METLIPLCPGLRLITDLACYSCCASLGLISAQQRRYTGLLT